MLSCFDLLCEYMENPLGTDEKIPRFSWKIKSDKQDTLQMAYEIRIENMWETGRVENDASINIPYGGAPLSPMTCYTWSVRVWDNHGQCSPWARGTFETALLDTPWQAQWVMADEAALDSCPVFRKVFTLKSVPDDARIYATALGNYEILINGKRQGDNWLSPGFVSYNKRLPYQTYIARGLKEGENEIQVFLAKGWARGRLSRFHNVFHLKPGILLQLCADGGVIEKTDTSWVYDNSPYLISELYSGETYDATRENTLFQNPKRVLPLDYPTAHLRAQNNELVRIVEKIKPQRLFITPKGETVLDFGQNMVGWASFQVSGKKGDKVILSFAEVLDKEGNFYTENMRTAKNHVEYRLKGECMETYHPHFTFQGFRYVRIDAFPGTVSLDQFEGLVIHSDFKRTGYFTCGVPQVNQLFSNVIWGQKGNFVDIPTDCPQRDERLGWTGDAQVFIKTAALNYQVAAFFEKWLEDMRLDMNDQSCMVHMVPEIGLTEETCSAAWGDAVTICPWEMYRAFHDTRLLEKQFDSMKAWVDHIRNQGENPFLWDTGFQFGDWLALDGEEGFYFGATANALVATVFFAHSARLVAKAAKVLGKNREAVDYQCLCEHIKEAFQKTFVKKDGTLTSHTQTAYALALFFDMVKDKQTAVQCLADLVAENGMRLTTGFVGTPYLCHALSENGRADVAYSLLLQTEYPSWLYSVSKGATTIWEHWDGIKPDGSFWDKKMNSYNHYAYGSIADWLYTKAAGIHYDEEKPAYKHILIKPMPDKRMGHVHAKVNTIRGTVVSAWRFEGKQIAYHVEIPAGATAEFIYPDGKQISLGSGSYDL